MNGSSSLSRSVKSLTVLVTGAASGMGKATAEVFAAEGANVAVTDYQGDGAQAVARDIVSRGDVAHAWKLDVSDSDEISRVTADLVSRFGGLDIVVNNAGIAGFCAIDDPRYED